MVALYWSEVVDAIKDSLALLVADLATGEILAVTRPLELMFGYTVRGELIGKNVDDLVPDAIRPRHAAHRQSYADVPRDRPMGAQLDLSGQRKDATVFPLEIMLTASLIGTKRCVIALVIDFTEREASRRAYETTLRQGH